MPKLQEYQILQGDNLQRIALNSFRDASRWPEIVDFNGLEAPFIVDQDQMPDFQREVSASGLVRFTRKSGIAGTFTIPAGTRVSTDPTQPGGQRIYQTAVSATLQDGSTTVDVLTEYPYPGSFGNVVAGGITTLVTPDPIPLVSKTVIVDFTNKTPGNTSVNANVAEYGTGSTFGNPTSAQYSPEFYASDYTNIQIAGDGKLALKNTTTANYYGMMLVKFDLLNSLKQQNIIPVTWTVTDLKNNLGSLSISYSGYGSGSAPYTNLLSANQSNIETDANNWSSYIGKTGITLSRDISTAWQGTASLKVVTDGTVSAQGSHTGYMSATGGQVYNGSVYVKGTAGVYISPVITYYDANGTSINGGGTSGPGVLMDGTWKRVSISMQAPANAGRVYIGAAVNGTVSTTFWIDGAMLDTGSVVHPWIVGGSTSNVGGTLTYGSQMNLWNTVAAAWNLAQSGTASAVETKTWTGDWTNYVDNNGVLYAEVNSTYTSDGTTAAQVNLDYIKATVILNAPSDPTPPVTSYLSTTVTNLDNFTNGRIWRVRFVGETILIPFDLEGLPNNNGETYQDLDTAIGGIDLGLDSGEFDKDRYGDVQAVQGMVNILQALRDRLATEKGALVDHPDYGSNIHQYIGNNLPFSDRLIQLEITSTILRDPRIADVEIVSFYRSGTAINVDVVLRIAGRQTPNRVTINL